MHEFAAATAVEQIDSHTYGLNFPTAWAIGTVPNGGYVTSCIIAAARHHFQTTLARQRQPDCMILHLEFPQRTSVGPATVTVSDVKLGRQTSTVHVTLAQGERRAEVVGYLTFSDVRAERGLSLPTAWRLAPAPVPVATSFAAVAAGSDPGWVRHPVPWPEFRHASNRIELYYPRQGTNYPAGRGSLDHWLRLSSGEYFTPAALGFVADVALQVTEAYKGDRDALDQAGLADAKQLDPLWYPTLVLNLELKKPLPEEGVEWLFTRVVAKIIRNGRMDLEVFIVDAAGDLVAVSHHVVMILSASRNRAPRGQQAETKKKEKEKEKL